jgi:hypothetical protein
MARHPATAATGARSPRPADTSSTSGTRTGTGPASRSRPTAAAAAERQRRFRQRKAPDDPPPDGTSRENQRRDNGSRNGVSHTTQARPGQASTPLLTLVGRLAVSDARGTPPPAEQIALWQDIAGPDVDLEAEARAYLERNLGRPARDEAAAWVGWLRKGARTPRAINPSTGRDCRTPRCDRGWLPPDDAEGRPVPCPTCRPHLQPVPTPRPEAS